MPVRRAVIAGAWHLLPLLPLAFGHYYAATAACLLVGVPYIKTAKFRTMLTDLLERYPEPRNAVVMAEVRLLEKKRRRWAYLTLTKSVDAQPDPTV